MTDIIPSKTATGKAEAFDAGRDEAIEIGQWYWVRPQKDGGRWLGCVMTIGSNYVELHSPQRAGGYHSIRALFDEFYEITERVEDPEGYIAKMVQRSNETIGTLLGEVKEVTRRIGVAPTEQAAIKSGDSQNALVVLSTQVDTDAYKRELVLAKEKTLPDLFKAIEEANKDLAMWMMAPTLPMKASMGPMKQAIDQIDDRIYTIELYAGLTEEAYLVKDGKPASVDEQLHVMQRRLYMDEECLCNYTAGGIDIKTIHDFDEWLAVPENADRIFGYQRALVAFRVRRTEKERENGGDTWRAFVNAQIAMADKKTFVYIRNGEQIWRITCDFEFDEMIFPDQTIFDPSRPMMVKMFGNRIDKIITRDEYEIRLAAEEAKYAKYKQWEADNPGESWIHNPHHNSVGFSYETKQFQPFDATNTHFDEIAKHFSDEIKRYNRVAVIIQGLFDRSRVLHPHHPVKVWDPASFDRAIKLVYDATTLTHGDKPDFEAYRARLNASISSESIVTGQQDYWLRESAERINKKNNHGAWRDGRRPTHYRRFKPYDESGPGLVSQISEWKPRVRKALFRWEKETEFSWSRVRDKVNRVTTVPVEELFNVSAYTPGDYKQFFADPRTRAEYFKWAPLLLAAEDYHAGKIKLNQPDKVINDYGPY